MTGWQILLLYPTIRRSPFHSGQPTFHSH